MDPATDPQLAWARSGAMALTGREDGPPQLARGPLARFAADEVTRLARATRSPRLATLDGARLLGERAAIAGLRRSGRASPGGSARLVACRDGWLAVNLARAEDHALLPAWLETEADAFAGDPWPALEVRCRDRAAGDLAQRAELCGLPVAETDTCRDAVSPHRSCSEGTPREPRTPLRVVDLASLWAGPLCTHLLLLSGARVIKVESRNRPDGARRGPPAFFSLLNAGKRCVSMDFTDPEEMRRLKALLSQADIVVESARARGLRQLGIHAEALLARCPGLVWVSITGYGRDDPRVAFGDDAACAAGLAATQTGEPRFCGDAIADPLTGIHAARVAFEARAAGGGVLLDVPLSHVAACAARGALPEARVVRRGTGWQVETANGRVPVAPPRARGRTC